LLSALALCASGVSTALAQLPQTRLYAIFPVGGQKGTNFDLTITNGVDLDNVNQLIFSHAGIKAVQKTAMNAAGQPEPVPNQFTVTIDPSVPPGLYDVRARGMFGVSNPRTFVVGDRKEAEEVEPNNAVAQATPLEINATMNGRSNGGTDIDYFKFAGKQGQRLVIECMAERIDSRMNATVELLAPSGKVIATNRNRFRRDPLIDIALPADGEYLIKVYDFTYQGSNDYFYRLTAHTGPHIDFAFPAAVLPGTTAQVTLYGRNLPGGKPSAVQVAGQPLEEVQVAISMPSEPATLQPGENMGPAEAGVDGISYTLTGPAGASNPVMIFRATAPVVAEKEPNDAPAQAAALTAPVEYAGQFQSRDDVDQVIFEAKAKEVYWIEVFGQRNGGNTDPYFVIDQVTVDDKGMEKVTRVTAQDDNTTNLDPARPIAFDARNDDPAFRLVVPADAKYRISVRDRYHRGDPQFVYRLSIRKEHPDFRLAAFPVTPFNPQNPQGSGIWDLGVRKGDNVQFDVVAFRLDGCNETIDVTVEGLPPGVTCTGASIGPGQTATSLILSSKDDVAPWTGMIRVLGKARIDEPSAVQAEVDAEAAHKAAVAALPPLDKAATDTAAAAKVAADKAAAAKAASDQKTDDQGLAKAKDDAAKASDAAASAAKTAADAKAAGEKRIADADQAVKAAQAQRKATAKDVVREARTGTIVWGGENNQAPVKARLARSLAMSTEAELAPYQVLTDVTKAEVNQSSQILIPLKLLKRNGFDQNVTLTFVGQPQNAQIENKPINQGKDSELLRVFIAQNTPPGTYTMHLRAQAQVSYRHNPEAAEAAKKVKEETDKQVAAVTEESKKANEAKAAAEKKFNDAVAAAKKAEEDRVKGDKAAADADAAAKAATTAAAAAKEAADKDAANKDLAAAKEAADKKVTETADALKKAADAKVVTDKAAADMAAAQKTAEAEKQVADKAAVDKAEEVKKVTAMKQAADKKATDTDNIAKPKNINLTSPSPAIVVTVKQGPMTLAANGGNVKKGDKLEVKVSVNRINGFAGPVELSLPLPPGVVGLKANPVTIPADMKEGALIIEAAGDATEGQLPNMVIRGSTEFNGRAAVDQPIQLNVVK
jgi:hypothetical protein